MKLGNHLIFDFINIDNNRVGEVDYVKYLMLEVCRLMKMHVITYEFHQFEPYGVSGVVIIQESHVSIHTWPEHNFVSCDFFSCDLKADLNIGFEFLKKKLKPKDVKKTLIERGF